MGTSYLKVGKLQDAAFWFAVLKETSKDFHNDAVYNLAYIDYVQQKYDTALQGFREVQDDRKFRKLAPYYIADIYLIQEIMHRPERWQMLIWLCIRKRSMPLR